MAILPDGVTCAIVNNMIIRDVLGANIVRKCDGLGVYAIESELAPYSICGPCTMV